MATIIDRALELVPANGRIGLGSGRAAHEFAQALGARLRSGFAIECAVATSKETEELAASLGIPLASLAAIDSLDVTFDGADEADPNLDLIKGYGRALVREKVVAASSRLLVILVGEEKLVPALGARGRLPIEVVPFALPYCQRRLTSLGLKPKPDVRDGELFVTDNGNRILDCHVAAIANPEQLEAMLRSIPGIVGTGLFLKMASVVLVGSGPTMELKTELRR
ncbi:MAG: ribose-5-phosphate isomerase RpiA [Gemmataceae bacterium]|nr:ribose-5-phosphate isomerase RpiA [Gemmataceae bacterium]